MKIILLLVVSILNIFAWFNEDFNCNDTFAIWLPFFAIVFSLLSIMPKLVSGKIEIKLIYFFIFGALYFNTSWYFTLLFNTSELFFILEHFGISFQNFIKSNLLMGISLPLIIAGYLFKDREYSKACFQDCISIKPIRISPFIYLTIFFLVLSISVTGLSFGNTYIGTSSYFYILLYRMVILSCVIFSLNYILYSGNLSVGIVDLFINNKILFAILICFWIYVAVGGDRGPILSTMMILLFGYLTMNKMRIKYSYVLLLGVGVFVMSTLFTFIEIFRIEGSEKILSYEMIKKTYLLIAEYEKNLNSSERCTAFAIEGIGNGLYTHTYGLFFVQSVFKGIPFFGNMISELIMPIIPNGSAELLTIQKSGVDYTSGIGTTYLADLYIEFGLLGIIVVSFMYGMMVSFFDNKCRLQSFKNIKQYLFIALFFGFSIYTGRGTLGGFVVYFIHTWVFYIIIKYFLMILRVPLPK